MWFELFILLFCSFITLSNGCFSSGSHSARDPEAAKLRRAEQKENMIISPIDQNNDGPEFEVDQNFIKDYLAEFGHLPIKRANYDQSDLKQAIQHFQEFMGFKNTGKMDLPTLARMSWKRCGNSDEGYSAPLIWERTTLFWYLDQQSIPREFPFSLQDMKELIRQAFAAWEIVIAMEFLETNKPQDAQIIFSVGDQKRNSTTGRTGLGIATATPAPLSQIWLNRHENWSTFQTQEEGKIDIFLVLIHEIGHSLGLKHSGDEQSVMFPMFERGVGDLLPVISNDDVERLRALYESNEPVDEHKTDTKTPISQPQQPIPPQSSPIGRTDGQVEKCPHKIEAAANVNADNLFVFGGTNGSSVWQFKEGKLVGGPYPIDDIFPDGPDTVDVAFSAGRLTILIKSRTVFGYEYDAQSNKFKRAKGFPRELHNRILFFPDAAFPIANGSIILIRDKVFATYNAETNTPHMLGSVDEFFPNLPQGLRSGFSASPDFSLYHMLTSDYAFLYDVRITRSVGSQSIGQFLGCDSTASNGVSQAQKPMMEAQIPSFKKKMMTQTTDQNGSKMINGRGPPGT